MNPESSQTKTSAWLAPGVALMQRFRMSAKLAVMATILVVPLVLVTYLQLVRLLNDYSTAKSEAVGARLISQITDLVTEVQHHRIESVMSAQPEFEKSRAKTRAQLDSLIPQVDTVVKAEPRLALAESWGAVQPELLAIAAAIHALGGLA